MIHTTHPEEAFSLPLPITQTARRFAEQLASQQPTREKAEQVRLNTLAICVVHDYLELMGISTNLEAGDSWNPVVQLGADVADLEVVGAGRLECRPVVLSGSGEAANLEELNHQTCTIPPEVWEDRIGYAVVQLDEAANAASLLGFVTTAAVEELSLSQLNPPEAMLDHLADLLHPTPTPASTLASDTPSVNLSQWLQNLFESGWQTVESLLAPPDAGLTFAFRGTRGLDGAMLDRPTSQVRRAKLIHFGGSLAQPIALIVELIPGPEGYTHIYLQVHPTGDSIYLPADLTLTVLDQAGGLFLNAQSRATDNYIQLQLGGHSGERFSVQVSFEGASVLESFVI